MISRGRPQLNKSKHDFTPVRSLGPTPVPSAGATGQAGQAGQAKLNKSDVGFSRKCPWAVDLENMAMPSARSSSTKTDLRGKAALEELCTFSTNVPFILLRCKHFLVIQLSLLQALDVETLHERCNIVFDVALDSLASSVRALDVV